MKGPTEAELKEIDERNVVATRAMQEHPGALWASRSAAAFVGGAFAVGWTALLLEPAVGLAAGAAIGAGGGALAGFLTHWCLEKVNPQGMANVVSRFSTDKNFAAVQEERQGERARAKEAADPGRDRRIFETVSFAGLGALTTGNLWGAIGGAALGYVLARVSQLGDDPARPVKAAVAPRNDPNPH